MKKIERYIAFPEWIKIYEKYTLPEWWRKAKETDEEGFYKTIAKMLDDDFGSHWIDVDWDDDCIIVRYGSTTHISSRYKIYGQSSLDAIVTELIELFTQHYSDERLREIACL